MNFAPCLKPNIISIFFNEVKLSPFYGRMGFQWNKPEPVYQRILCNMFISNSFEIRLTNFL